MRERERERGRERERERERERAEKEEDEEERAAGRGCGLWSDEKRERKNEGVEVREQESCTSSSLDTASFPSLPMRGTLASLFRVAITTARDGPTKSKSEAKKKQTTPIAPVVVVGRVVDDQPVGRLFALQDGRGEVLLGGSRCAGGAAVDRGLFPGLRMKVERRSKREKESGRRA